MNCQVEYRSSKLLGLSSESEDGSADESDVWKRSLTNRQSDTEAPAPEEAEPQASAAEPVGGASRKRKVNKIWSNVLVEEDVVSELCQIGLKSKPVDLQDRSCENYDFRLKYTDPRRELDMEMDDDSDDNAFDSDGICDDSTKRNKFKKFRKTSESSSLDSLDKKPFRRHKKGSVDYSSGRFPKLNSADMEVARKIIRSLAERKHYLIHRVVHTIGAEKAMKLLKMTEEIEDHGGMLIKNNSRRRTPGGVYLQLLKADKDITPEQVDEIFAHEISFDKLKELRKEQRKMLREKGVVKRRKKKKRSKERSGADKMQVEDSTPANGDASTTECFQPMSSLPCEEVKFTNSLAVQEVKVKVENTNEDSDIEDGEIVDT